MSWTSLDEDDATSSSDADEEFVEPDNSVKRINGLEKRAKGPNGESRYFGLEHGSRTQIEESDSLYSSQDQSNPSNPFVQAPNSDSEINSRKEGPSHQKFKNLLAIKDDHIRTLQKLINGQREQLYHFLNMSLKKETLLELKKTCRETEALNRNENICMAVDKFKYDNNIPTEQTLVREDVSRTLLKIERLMRHQTRLVKSMEPGEEADEKCEEAAENSNEISCYRSENQLTDVQKLLKGTKQFQRKIQILKIQLKKLSLIEQERIDLVERVYSMPPDQRQYYAHLAVIEREKIQLRLEIDQLSENYRDLKEKCCLLEEAEQELNKCIDSKIADLDLNKIKPGLETHLELMDMVERGELSLITMTKDEKGKFTGDFMKLYNENAEISERLTDFDKVTRERDDLKRQIEVLVENCLRLQSEVKALRLASKTDELMEQLRLACLEREELRTNLERLTTKAPGVLGIAAEIVEKTFKRGTKPCKPEEAKPAHIALQLDKNCKNPDMAISMDEDRFKNMPKQLEDIAEVEKQSERLVLEISRYRYALLRQENEIKDLVVIVEKLMEQIKTLKLNSGVNPIEGIPEGPDILPPAVLSFEEEKRLEIIRNRIRQNNSKNKTGTKAEFICPSNSNNLEKNTFIASVRSFLGLDNSLMKTTDH